MRSIRILALSVTALLTAPLSAGAVSFGHGSVVCTPNTDNVSISYSLHDRGMNGYLIYQDGTTVDKYRFSASGESTGASRQMSGKKKHTLDFGKFKIDCVSEDVRGAGSCSKQATKTGFKGVCTSCGQQDGKSKGGCYAASYSVEKEK